MRAGFWFGLQPYLSSISFICSPPYLLIITSSPPTRDVEGDAIVLVERRPEPFGQRGGVELRQLYLDRLPMEARQRRAEALVGADEAARAGLRGLVLVEVPQAGRAGLAPGLEYGELEAPVGAQEAGDARRPVGAVGLEFARAQRGGEGRPARIWSRTVSVWSPFVTTVPRPTRRTGW